MPHMEHGESHKNRKRKMNFKFDAEHTFFTSDTHFNHTNIIRFCNRPFRNVDEMNETIVANWNATIGMDDTVFTSATSAWGELPNGQGCLTD